MTARQIWIAIEKYAYQTQISYFTRLIELIST